MNYFNKKWISIGCFAVIALGVNAVFVVIMIIGFGVNSGWLASTAALPQNEIPPTHLAEISQIVNLRPNEDVLYFYSAALTVSGDGNLFTNERVISYTTSEGATHVYDASYAEIKDIAFQPSNSWIDDSTIAVTLMDDTWFELWVSNEAGGDKKFYDRLVQEWKRPRDP